MKKNVLKMIMLSALLFASCNNKSKQEIKEIEINNTIEKSADEIVKSILTNKEGKKLEMSFNNRKDIVTVNFSGETIEMKSQKPASGIWYKNDEYELTGKGESVELKKDGKIVFKN